MARLSHQTRVDQENAASIAWLRPVPLRVFLLGSAVSVSLALSSPVLAGGLSSTALPTGGSVTSGSATISQSGSNLKINQTSSDVIINWQTFNIGSQASVNFLQPNAQSIALNRVLSSDASTILGKLSANGQVILINPNGVVFGGGAEVNVGGLVASVLDIKDSDFLSGNMAFSRNGATGTITNQGALTAADGGYVALLAPQIANQGVITARLGTVALASGDAVTLSFNGMGNIGLKVDAATVQSQINQGGLIIAPNGQVLMTAKAANALLGGTINDGGAIEANSVTSNGGEITLDASGPITVAGGTLDASGATGGGSITIGGWQTASVSVDQASSLNASATSNGNGGSISVIGGDAKVQGTLTAQGGVSGGNGGTIETSGHTLEIGGAVVSTRAAQGKTGTWLLDPSDFTIAASGGDISGSDLSTALNSNNVTILSSQGTVNTNGNGDITVNDAVSWSSPTTLTLSAQRNVAVNAAISNSSIANVVLQADNTATGTGTVTFGVGGGVSTGGQVSIYYNPTSYAAPTDYSGKVGGGASLTAYMLVNNVLGLQNISTNENGTYALNQDIDASATAGWNNGAGFTPISSFSGLLDGQNYTISGLTINSSTGSNVGLIGTNNGTIENLTLSGGSVTSNASNVGALAGTNNGTVSNVSSSINVTGGTKGTQWVAGLVADNYGSVLDSSTSGTVSGGTSTWERVGGVVATNELGATVNSTSSATVTGGRSGWNDVGGVVATNYGSVGDLSSTGTVISDGGSGSYNIGGVVGINWGTIGSSTSSATLVDRTGASGWFGLVAGTNEGSIEGVIVTGSIFGTNNGGSVVIGLVAGTNSGTIDSSAAYGSVTGGNFTSTGFPSQTLGLLVGSNGGTITNSTAIGTVTGGDNINSQTLGLLSGSNSGTITNSTAGGAVTGGNNASFQNMGLLVGQNGGTISGGAVNGTVNAGDSAFQNVGALVGQNNGTITGSIAAGLSRMTGALRRGGTPHRTHPGQVAAVPHIGKADQQHGKKHRQVRHRGQGQLPCVAHHRRTLHRLRGRAGRPGFQLAIFLHQRSAVGGPLGGRRRSHGRAQPLQLGRLAENHGPREEKGNFHFKNQKHQRDHVKPEIELHETRSHRLLAAFVRLKFLGRGEPCPQKPPHQQRNQREQNPYRQKEREISDDRRWGHGMERGSSADGRMATILGHATIIATRAGADRRLRPVADRPRLRRPAETRTTPPGFGEAR